MNDETRAALLKLWDRWPECRHHGIHKSNLERSEYIEAEARQDDETCSDLACAAIERQLAKTNLSLSYVNGRLDLCAMGGTSQRWDYVAFDAATKLGTLIHAANAIRDAESRNHLAVVAPARDGPKAGANESTAR